MMVQETDRIVVGTRFKLSKLGADRCPELAGQTGVVVDVSPRTTGNRAVRWRQKINLPAHGLHISRRG